MIFCALYSNAGLTSEGAVDHHLMVLIVQNFETLDLFKPVGAFLLDCLDIQEVFVSEILVFY